MAKALCALQNLASRGPEREVLDCGGVKRRMVGASDALLLSEWHTLALVVCASVGFVLLTRREGLLELVGLVRVGDAQGVQVLGAPDLELGHVARLLDLDGASILPASRQEEVLDFVYLLRL